jgi:hypothetical protein
LRFLKATANTFSKTVIHSIDRVKNGSIFDIRSENAKELLLINAKDRFFFTVESHKMEFYTESDQKKSD